MKNQSEYRKIQSTGKGSYIITLPREWIRDLNLEKGNLLAVEIQDDSSILLSPRDIFGVRNKETSRKYKILTEPKEEPSSLCRKIACLYVHGANIIQVYVTEAKISPEQKEAIRNLIRDVLVGVEILHEKPDQITFQVLITGSEFSVESAIRRMATLAISANSDVISNIDRMDKKLIKGVTETYSDVKRLNLFIIRQLKYGLEHNIFKMLGFESKHEFLGYRIVTNEIKNITENTLTLANNILALRESNKDQLLIQEEKAFSEISKFSSEAHSLFDESLKALFKRDYQQADKLITKMELFVAFEKKFIDLLDAEKIEPNALHILRLIVDDSMRIIKSGMNISEVTLNRAVERISQLF